MKLSQLFESATKLPGKLPPLKYGKNLSTSSLRNRYEITVGGKLIGTLESSNLTDSRRHARTIRSHEVKIRYNEQAFRESSPRLSDIKAQMMRFLNSQHEEV